jgi:hypothetical protein
MRIVNMKDENQWPKVLFVASRKKDRKILGSRLIAWSTSRLEPQIAPCSHLAIILRKTLVIESTASTGVRIMPYEAWARDNEVVHAFEKPYKGVLSQYIPQLMRKLWDVDYDYLGIAYFAWRMLLRIYLGRPLPKTNPWESEDRRYCVEIFGDKSELSMVSPIQLVARWYSDHTLRPRPEYVD